MDIPAWLRFIAHYEDEAITGNSLGSRDSGWTSLPDKSIQHLEYVMPYGDSVILHGYDEYLHMVEASQKMGGQPLVNYVYLMGRRGKTVISYRITILQKTPHARFKVGDITVRMAPVGSEYHSKPISGWRKGK